MGHWRALTFATVVSILAVFTILLRTASPGAFANPQTGLTAVSAGEGATCAVTTGAGVKCWGQLAPTNSPLPSDLTGLSGISDVSVGSAFACALTQAGSASCWGANDYGQLGGGSLSGVARLSAGFQYACAVMAAGGVMCWGANDYGQLGDGTAGMSPVPVEVAGLGGPVAGVAAAYHHTCAVTTSGSAQCWGRNDYGQLGDGSSTSRLSATNVIGLGSGVAAVAATLNASCAVKSDGSVMCWGLGYGTAPVSLVGASGAIAIDAGFSHFCALTSSGGVTCWGTNGYGELGDGLACGPQCHSPVLALSGGATAVSAGVYDTCALMSSGTAKCWGVNASGQIGSGSSDVQINIPVDVVQHDVKPLPTPAPCQPKGCPTPTPITGLPETGVDFTISIDSNGDGVAECGTGTGQAPECSLPPNSVFQVILSLNALPAGVSRYAGFDLGLEFFGVNARATWTPLWPDCVLPAQDFSLAFPPPSISPASLLIGCAGGLNAQSAYGGRMAAIDFSCSGTGSISMGHSRDLQGHMLEAAITTRELQIYWQYHETQPALLINCGPLIRGDANCSRTVNAVDAELMLQFAASLIRNLGCRQQSDVNLDSVTNAIDASLTLQYDATLIGSLPPNQVHR